jgi:hypothetical protein
MPRPDPELLLAALAPEDRDAVVRWLATLGFEPEELDSVPPLQQLVAMLAVLRVASDMGDLPRAERFTEAAAALDLNGRSLLRRWYAWQERAVRRFVTQEDAAA